MTGPHTHELSEQVEVLARLIAVELRQRTCIVYLVQPKIVESM